MSFKMIEMNAVLESFQIWDNLEKIIHKIDTKALVNEILEIDEERVFKIFDYCVDDVCYEEISFASPVSAKLKGISISLSRTLDSNNNDDYVSRLIRFHYLLTVDISVYEGKQVSETERIVANMILLFTDDLKLNDTDWDINMSSPFVIAKRSDSKEDSLGTKAGDNFVAPEALESDAQAPQKPTTKEIRQRREQGFIKFATLFASDAIVPNSEDNSQTYEKLFKDEQDSLKRRSREISKYSITERIIREMTFEDEPLNSELYQTILNTSTIYNSLSAQKILGGNAAQREQIEQYWQSLPSNGSQGTISQSSVLDMVNPIFFAVTAKEIVKYGVEQRFFETLRNAVLLRIVGREILESESSVQ